MTEDGRRNNRPPKEHQFKKGEKSPCPDGGWSKKREKKAKAKKAEKSPQEMVTEWFTSKRKVKINGKVQELTRLELALAQLEDDAFLKRDHQARKLLFDIAQRNGWLKAPPAKTRPMVLVVNGIKTAEEWAKSTEGELLPRDPLHGIPGAEGMLEQQDPPRGFTPP